MRSAKKRAGPPAGRVGSHSFWPIALVFAVIICLILFFLFSRTGWDKKSRFSLLMQTPSKDLLLISVEPSQNRGNIILIPANTQMDLPYGYKTYPASSIYRLGELDDKRGGGVLLKKSSETTLGVKIDGFIIFDASSVNNWPKSRTQLVAFKKSNFSYFRGMPFFQQFIGSQATSDLNFFQRLAFYNAVRRLRSDQIQFIDLKEGVYAKEILLPDQSKVIRLDTDAFDFQLGNNFQDISIRREEVTVEVVNASSLERIASQFARVLSRLGSNVIAKSTAGETNKEACLLLFLNEKARQSLIVSILKKDYACLEKSKSNSRQMQSSADIIIMLGEDFIK